MLTVPDQQLFLFLNSHHSPFFDSVMTIISFPPTWIPLYLAIIIYLVKKMGRRMLAMVVVVALLITASDQLSVMVKNSVKRPRPCYEKALEGKVHTVEGNCGGTYGFYSSHASNSFAVALLSLCLIRRRWFSMSMIIWALVIGYSRIYLGVHYPGDVICGSVMGAIIGRTAYFLFDYTDRKYLRKSFFFYPSQKES